MSLKDCTSWREAATLVVTEMIKTLSCFSSGEIVRILRTERPDFAFRVGSVGEMLREMFHQAQMPEYILPDGSVVSPYQGMRITEGRYPDRTPAGTGVYVYGPSEEAINSHEFEIFIPIPGETIADDPGYDTSNVTMPLSTASVVMQDTMRNPITASVWTDGRISIPRKALESAAYLAGDMLQAGKTVYMKQTETTLIILLDDPCDPEYKPYKVTPQGRIGFASNMVPFTAGDEYPCTVEAKRITVTLN